MNKKARQHITGNPEACCLILPGISIIGSKEYHYHKHLILLFAIHCMRMFCRHDDGFAFVEFVFYAVDGDFTGSVEAGDEGVAAGLVGADFFAFVEGK